jgi:hypothetical protein
MSPYVLNIDQSGCGRDISKSGGHNWEVEISKVACWLPGLQALGGAALAHTGLSFVPSSPASSSLDLMSSFNDTSIDPL